MNLPKNNFIKATKEVLKSKSIEEEIKAINNLVKSYENFISKEFIEVENEIKTKGGIALSSKHAKDCIEDPIRTARFLKGVDRAIHHVLGIFKNEKITILYGGTGPLGTLIIPLLGLFSPNKIEVIFLDINKSSIESVKKIIWELDYEDYVLDYVVADAIKYKSTCSLNLIITETMDKALIKEPQVEITRNLGKQLSENGIFIPESIDITRGFSFFAKEFLFDLRKDLSKLKTQQNNFIEEKMFSITPKMKIEDYFTYETNWLYKPKTNIRKPDICLYTEVTIYEDIKLKKSESFITNPICVKSLQVIKGKQYKLQYSTKDIPNWKVLEK